jgi:hypothetical protein
MDPRGLISGHDVPTLLLHRNSSCTVLSGCAQADWRVPLAAVLDEFTERMGRDIPHHTESDFGKVCLELCPVKAVIVNAGSHVWNMEYSRLNVQVGDAEKALGMEQLIDRPKDACYISNMVQGRDGNDQVVAARGQRIVRKVQSHCLDVLKTTPLAPVETTG